MSHISKVNSDRFESAVRKALANIIADKQAFCLNDVIRKARYPDGSAVGATTLYAKNSEGQYVHATLLAHIKAASVRSKLRGRASAKKSSGHPNETLTANGEPTALYRQLLEQESRLQELDRNLASLNLQL